MRSTRNLAQIVSVSAFLVAGILSSRTAHAEADTFGVGSGRTGPLAVTTAGTVVNAYASITATVAVNATSITVGSSAGFAAGDLILVWQTTGVATAVSGSPAATDLSLVPTGSFEYARIKSVAGGTITLTNPLVSATGFAANTSQIVRIPEYTTLSVSGAGSIVAAPWDGLKGGIVAIFAKNTVTNDTLISATSSGFRGGVLVNDVLVNGCTANDGPVVAAAIAPLDFNVLAGGAKKGEGLLPGDFSTSNADPTNAANLVTYGRGNVTNGGGGGDCSNSGGAGGGHGGIGGSGGVTWTGETDVGGIAVGARAVGGTGGAPLLYSPTSRLAFGGGGGAGEENNMVGTAGASGGGVVLLRVGALAGAGTISANGATAGNAVNDGAGGGGAGGLVVVLSAADATCGGLQAIGGVGGNCATDHGPGGGGAGGFILLQSASGTCSRTVTGGASGLDGADAQRGANAGAAGTLTTPGAGGFTPTTCDVAIDQCGGCVVDTDCGSGGTCNTTTNMCTLADGGAGDGGTDGGTDGGLGDAGTDAGLSDAGADGGTRTDGGLADGGSGGDGGSGLDGGSSGDGGNGNGDDGGSTNVFFPGDLEGGGCGCSTPGTDGENGTAFLGLGLIAGLAFLRRKKR